MSFEFKFLESPSGEKDDIVATGAYVHIERMDDGHIWIGIGDSDKKNTRLSIHLMARSPIKIETLEEGKDLFSG